MKITGPSKYVDLLDKEVYSTFLRSQGLPERKIETLRVRFMRELPEPFVTQIKLFPKPLGHYTFGKNSIELATYWVKNESDLDELQRVLLHESAHLCGGRKEQIIGRLYVGLLMLLNYVLLASLQRILPTTLPFILNAAIFMTVQVIALVSTYKLGYRFAPMEQRANKWMKTSAQLFKKEQP